jgi:exosortase
LNFSFSGVVQLVVLLILWGLVFAPVVPQMVSTWLQHSDNSHAVLVPFISLYFAWTKRRELAAVEFNGSFWGGIFLASCLVIYLVSYIGGIAFFFRLMIVGSLIGLVWNCYGWPALRVLAFPLVFLFFMVPVPDTLLNLVSFPLQLQATKISVWIINVFGMPVYREGNMLYFAQAQLEVAEACSGIRSIISLVMLSVLLSYISTSGFLQKAILVACAIPAAMMANILRVSGTGILAHFFGDQVARGFLHDFSGMVVFAFGLSVIFFISKLLNIIFRNNTGAS